MSSGHDRLKDFIADDRGEVAARIGKYEIEREIGRGGMATVYEAWDPDLDRRVAVKVLKEGNLERLRREAAAAARLRHPNIVAVHEVGPSFIVMDLVEGRTLAAAAPSLSVPERLRIIETVARAIAFAHGEGVVHRDLKPQNIVLDGAGRPMLTDFGLAKLAGGDDLTVTGSVMGTPEYMAPEQVKGRDIGPAADIWALGVMIHEMATGERPFQGRTALDVYDQIARREPVVPAGPLGTVVLKALEKRPSRRYASATELADDLARYLGGESVWASRLPWRLRRLALPAIALGVIAAAAAAGVAFQRWRSAETATLGAAVPGTEEPLRWRQAEEAATLALEKRPDSVEHLIARATARYSLANALWNSGTYLSVNKAGEQDASRALELQPRSAPAHLIRGKIRTNIAAYKQRFGIDPLADCEAAIADLSAALELPEAILWRADARMFRARWRMRSNVDVKEELLALDAELSPADTSVRLKRRGRVRAYLRRFDEAERDFVGALRETPEDVWTWIWRGQARKEAGDPDAAEAHFSEAVRWGPRNSESWRHRGEFLFERERYAEASADFARALALDPALGSLLYDQLRKARDRSGSKP